MHISHSFFFVGSGAFLRGRDRDRDLGGAFQYSRRGLRLRRRGAYGIHRASGPMDAKGCVARLHPTGKTTHYILCVAGAPANHVRCASLRSGGCRLAVRTAMGNHIGAMPRTPFPASRDFPSRGNERYEGKKQRVIYFRYHFGVFPLWWLAPPPFPRSSVGRQKESALMGRLGALLRPTWRSYAGPPQWHYNPCLL